MNFLGHCYLTRNNKELMAGNLAGDYYKGDLKKFKKTKKNIIRGVEIHRFIDFNTDNSVYIQEAASLLQDSGIRRISYIATDILLDHYLAKKWKNYSNKNLESFIQKSYKWTENEIDNLPKDFSPLLKAMKKHNWLAKYKYDDGINLILHQFGQKIPFQNNLHESFPAYLENKKSINKLFKAFLSDIDEQVKHKFSL